MVSAVQDVFTFSIYSGAALRRNTELYSEASQITKMELLVKIVK